MPLVNIVDRRGELPASQANVERQKHGSVQHETVSDWEVRPQQHMDQLAKSRGGDWQPWTTDPGNPALLMPFVTRGRSAASAVVSGSPLGRGGDSALLPGSLGQCPASHVRLCVRQRHSTWSLKQVEGPIRRRQRSPDNVARRPNMSGACCRKSLGSRSGTCLQVVVLPRKGGTWSGEICALGASRRNSKWKWLYHHTGGEGELAQECFEKAVRGVVGSQLLLQKILDLS